MLLQKLNNKCIYFGLLTFTFAIFAINTNFSTPLYYHDSFVPNENYNILMKMSNDDFDVIEKLKKEIEYSNKDARIVTSNLFTESIIPSCEYIYGRTLPINTEWSDAEKQIYSIFYPSAYLGDVCKDIKADYGNVATYLKETGIDYLVLNKTQEYYDEETELYSYLLFKIAECGYGYSMYSNDTYEVFCFTNN